MNFINVDDIARGEAHHRLEVAEVARLADAEKLDDDVENGDDAGYQYHWDVVELAGLELVHREQVEVPAQVQRRSVAAAARSRLVGKA